MKDLDTGSILILAFGTFALFKFVEFVLDAVQHRRRMRKAELFNKFMEQIDVICNCPECRKRREE